MKPLIIYHDHCTDGFGAAFAAWMKFKDEAEYLPMSYGDKRVVLHAEWLDFPTVVALRDVYILDFSFSKEITEAIMDQADRVIWLDHHKTAFEVWCGGIPEQEVHEQHHPSGYILLDNNKSGAMIAWEYFHPGKEVPMMIKHIDDRDRWQFKIPGSKEFHAALASYKPWSFEQWSDWLRTENIDLMMYEEGAAILRAHEQNVKSLVDAGRREVVIRRWFPNEQGAMTEIQDYPGLSANCPPYAASDVGHELANASGTFGLCWYMGRDGKAKVSLRSNGDYDVSAIAKAFGGGGHQNAAGFEIDIPTLMGWMK